MQSANAATARGAKPKVNCGLAPDSSKPQGKNLKADNGDGPKPPPTPVLTAPPRSHSRRAIYSDEVMDEILRRMSHGETLKKVCASNPDFPSPATVIDWVHEDRHNLGDRYARARDRQLEAWAEEVLDKADASSTDQGAVQRDRLAVDARKWLLSKLKPEKYGDRVQADLTTGGQPLRAASDLDLAKALLAAMPQLLPAPDVIDAAVVLTESEGERS